MIGKQPCEGQTVDPRTLLRNPVGHTPLAFDTIKPFGQIKVRA